MKARYFKIIIFVAIAMLVAVFQSCEKAKEAIEPIVIGCPLSTAFLYGWDAERAITLAVEEINAEGGVNVGGEKRPFKMEVIDTRDLEPGVPVSDALLAVEKLILEK
jgi:branched-chain amino acid transport system substrate-binding protein